MKLTHTEKLEVLNRVQESLQNDFLCKEDAVIILEVLSGAAKRAQEEMLAEHPWLEPSDVVQ